MIESPHSGEGGIRTLGGHEDHNGFRDRPIQPLWHLSNLTDPAQASRMRRNYILNLHAFMQFRVMGSVELVFLEFFLQSRGGCFFAMHQKNLLHLIFDAQRVFH